MVIFKEFSFDAAHYLPNVEEGHKCKNLHGHTYRLRIFIKGAIDPQLGWVMDFGQIKAAWKTLEGQLDHRYLNDIKGLENPTAEILVQWIWKQLIAKIPKLHKLELYETATSGAIYSGNPED